MSMFNGTENQHSGQSFTLDVKTDSATGETVVTAPNVPEVEPVRDRDSRFAVQEMKRKLDDHVHRGFSQRTPLVIPGEEFDR
jgi:hypothetical protein